MKPTNEGDVINQGAPLRVKFSNVREKIKVLQASRNASQTLKDERISIIEDFTDKVRENTHLQGSSSSQVGGRRLLNRKNRRKVQTESETNQKHNFIPLIKAKITQLLFQIANTTTLQLQYVKPITK